MTRRKHEVVVECKLNEFRWQCSCGAVGPWKFRAHLATRGGSLHAEYFNDTEVKS